MTRLELDAHIKDLKQRAFNMIKNSSPVLTGNLKDSIRVKDIDNGFEVYIDTAQAPYAQYTIEKWTHPHWNGKTNPNEGWTHEATKEFIAYAKSSMKGVK